MAAAVVVEHVSKRYRLSTAGADRVPYRTLRDDIVRWAKWPLRRLRGQTGRSEDFWALKDVSFEVQPGEVVGIIGRNGAGKSTLLKILSRITKPTGGRIRLRGRVGSLLEVGTGFHPELTGRENIFLSGAVLGMTRAEIRRKFDEMVAFAEVEKFLDTPVKRYSSGMYTRLAFAVAAHLEPEILVVDEVLAVGDAAFQKKCLGKMSEIAHGGRTVLFVSHNIQAVRTLCSRGVLLESGRIRSNGSVESVLRSYHSATQQDLDVASAGLANRLYRASGKVRFQSVVLENGEGQATFTFPVGTTIRFRFRYRVFESVENLGFYLALKGGTSQEIVTTFKLPVVTSPLSPGDTGEFTLELPDANLRPGDYTVRMDLSDVGFNKGLDVLDENVNVPYITIISDNQDRHYRQGFFTMSHRLESVTCAQKPIEVQTGLHR